MKGCGCYINPQPDSLEKINMEFYQKGFTDGLPIIPPTPERVEKFYRYSLKDPEDVIAVLPPRNGKATIEKIAVNAVMAGCPPQLMPFLEHAIMAITEEKFNLAALNATTHPIAVAIIINGPMKDEIGFNYSTGCLGPGNLANATLGRALRLCLINIAGAMPGVGDHATMGSPAKYTYCFAENEDENPWEPLHVERGFPENSTTVTVMGAEAPYNVNDHRSIKPEDILDTIIHTISTAGSNNSHVPGEILVIMGPEHANSIADEGWEKEDVKDYIHENAMVPLDLADRGGRSFDKKLAEDNMVRITRSRDDIVIVVAGGIGRHTLVAPGFGESSKSITKPLKLKNGPYATSIENYLKR
ncbi:MAG TPA: hypothetical protein PLO64_02930 [Methanothermobacter sp.]|nr:conserved hypothetical protein [Methanothermobacter sp. MT-2]HHW04976.1 hypothetical protein [Methanothermobacter sp.]HOK72330.1 hypothetical protein [Methanothermobacter sp.]HOL68868.1 hypothetical protein [Methanothermobacter sp.]HPQ05316.1 hypothetical protein [Methanothermobacter sp.]